MQILIKTKKRKLPTTDSAIMAVGLFFTWTSVMRTTCFSGTSTIVGMTYCSLILTGTVELFSLLTGGYNTVVL